MISCKDRSEPHRKCEERIKELEERLAACLTLIRYYVNKEKGNE